LLHRRCRGPTSQRSFEVATVASLKRLRQGLADKELAPWHVMSNLLIREETSTAIESTCFYTIFLKD
jgi:hypothetical protein